MKVLGVERGFSLRSIACRAASNASPPAAVSPIPVIDIGPLVRARHPKAEKIEVAEKLHRACKDVGFFYVKNHGIPDTLSNRVLETARQWFQLPMDVKQRIKLSPETRYRGYQALGVNVTRYDGRLQHDWHEAIDFYKEETRETLENEGRQLSPIRGPNLWPEQHPAFCHVLKEYFASMEELGEVILRGISLGLALDEDALHSAMSTKFQDKPYWYARVIHYPPITRDGEDGNSKTIKAPGGEEVDRSVPLSCGAHTDYGLLTIINQEDHISALQIQNLRGEWTPADPIPGAFICNIGDMMKVLTNGAYTPTVHRVLNADKALSRVSIPFFYEPPYEAVIQPLESISSNSSPPMFSKVRYGTHLEGKVLNNFDFKLNEDRAELHKPLKVM